MERLTKDDEQARRLCALAVAFSNAPGPISSGEVHAGYYQELSDDSFRRKFSRDREKLVECGLTVRQAGERDGDALWQADASSFANSSALSEADALLLDVLCSPLASDPTFARRAELRLALAKIDHAFGTLGAARIDPAAQAGAPALPTMLGCMERGRLARIAYQDAHGTKSERTVAPYGHFSLRGNTYFVCAQAGDDGTVADPHDTRTLRLDRVLSAKETNARFGVPEDFSIEDHILLPFQIGPSTCEALLDEGTDVDSDLRAQLARRATSAGEGRWRVSASDVAGLASWAIAAGMMPVEPTEAVSEWRALLEAAASTQARPMPADVEPARRARAAGTRGRKGGTAEMRELVALVASLDEEGAFLSVETVAARLGVSAERAELLLNLLLTACVDTGYQLPLGLAEGDALVLTRSQGVTGRPIRLTPGENRALVEALDELGIAADDALRQDVLAAFGNAGFTQDEARRRVDAALDLDDEGAESDVLEACSRTILSGAWLAFAYQAAGQSEPATRRANPQGLRHDGDFWYLDAFDLDRDAMRTFRVDRMDDVRVMSHAAPGAGDELPAARDERTVQVAFAGTRFLDLLEWPRLEIVGVAGERHVGELPDYGGTWLPRHLAACGGDVVTSDEDLAARVRDVARELLA